jgi:hypothetical protein
MLSNDLLRFRIACIFTGGEVNELVANAISHQDFSLTGKPSGKMAQ